MSPHDTLSPSRSTGQPKSLVAVAALIALALVVVGARQVTVHLRADAPATLAAAPADGSPTAPAGTVAGATSGSPAAHAETGGQPLPADGDAVAGRITIGEVVIDEVFIHTSGPDLVTIASGPAPGARIADLPDEPPAGGGSAPGDGGGDDGSQQGGGSGISGTADGTADRPLDGTVDLTLGVRVETTGHFATVFIGIGGGMDGLTTLSVDFGDGGVLRLDDGQVTQLSISRAMNVVHEYVPTLTPQPQAVLVTATDSTGRTHDRTVDFHTRAAYLLTYSPLAVTALDDCDIFGKGDFELTWRLDSRPARSSSFQLGKGETHVEQGFRIGVTGVHYDEPLEHFRVRIEEHDPGPGQFGSVAFVEFPDGGPVAALANHHYEVTLDANDVENAGPVGSSLHWDCDVRMTFTAYLTMIDSLDR